MLVIPTLEKTGRGSRNRLLETILGYLSDSETGEGGG